MATAHKPRTAEMKPPTAHSLEEAANSDNSLEGYAAINTPDAEQRENDPEDDETEIAKIAYALYEERGGEHGQDRDDWYRAVEEYRRRRGSRTNTPERAS